MGSTEDGSLYCLKKTLFLPSFFWLENPCSYPTWSSERQESRSGRAGVIAELDSRKNQAEAPVGERKGISHQTGSDGRRCQLGQCVSPRDKLTNIGNSNKSYGFSFSHMRSKGSRLALGVWRLRVCSLEVTFASATDRNRSYFGGFKPCVTSFRMAGVALCDFPEHVS